MARYLVVGGGIAGIVSALYIKKLEPTARVVLVEKAPHIGGLLRSFDYGELGLFDYGMHNVALTGSPDVDQILFSLLDENKWDVLEGNNRDLAGVFFNGKLQLNTPYPDVRDLNKCEMYIRSALVSGRSIESDDCRPENAETLFIKRFGEDYAKDIVCPILEKVYRISPDKLDILAGRLLPLFRICAHSEKDLLELYDTSPDSRALFAFPEQRKLPPKYIPSLKCLYPSDRGCQRVVDGAIKKLSESGIEVITNADVSSVVINDSRVESVTIGTQKMSFDHVISTLGAVGTLGLVDKKYSQQFHDKPYHVAVVNLVVRSLTDELGDLHYFFCYDQGLKTHRVTVYNNFCSSLDDEKNTYLTVELLLDDAELEQLDINKRCIEELLEMRLIAEATEVLFSKVEILPYGFPLPSSGNMTAFSKAREHLNKQNIENLIVGGVLSEPDLFFQAEVIKDVCQKISHFSDAEIS